MPNALDGVKILDIGRLITVPLATEWLGAHGATVVIVESLRAPDPIRGLPPHAKNISGVNRSAIWAIYNASKYSIRLNLKNKASLDVLRRLITWADVVAENHIPGTMESLGMGYEEMKKIKSDIILLSASMQGQTGPHASHPGLGNMLQAITGITHLTSWPDRVPAGVGNPYTDYISFSFAIIAIMAGLEYRRRTGKGQFIDMSQCEASLYSLIPPILDYTTNDRVWQPLGNRHPVAVPHGAFRCRGDDSWCTIAIFNDIEWQILTDIINTDWARESTLSTMADRKEHEDELEKLIEGWTTNYDAQDLETILQNGGVRAGMVKNGRDLLKDTQLQSRGYFSFLEHPEMGVSLYQEAPFKLSGTSSEMWRAPCIGEHTEFVCCHLLGMPDSEFIELMDKGIFD